MGTFILTAFNTSLTTNGLSISLSGKDKMCMLNGELGGQLFASVDFGTEEVIGSLFREVVPASTDSDSLMSNTYYYEVDGNDANTENCIFDLDNNNGYWFCLNNVYIYDQNKQYVGNHYKKYKKVTHPDDLFNLIDFESENISYEPSKYFYKQNFEYTIDGITRFSPYYLLNTTASAKDQNYKLKKLYKYEQTYSIKKIPLEKIIREAVHAYAMEPYHNIIIQDLEKYGLEQISYKSDTPLVALRNLTTGHFSNIRFLDSFEVYENGNVIDLASFEWDELVEDSISASGSVIKVENQKFVMSTIEEYEDEQDDSKKKNFYRAAKITYGQDIGYRITDLVYNGELISGIGETLTSILDKIKNMLGDFEYFYDINGRFIFRRKPIYANTSWSHFVNNEDERYVTFTNDISKYSFNFEGNKLLTAIQNTPSLSNVKNDFIVWGKRQDINGAEIPIHARYAIDKKPEYYKALNGNIYATKLAVVQKYEPELLINEESPSSNINIVDWREIIYQMALDYFAGQGCSENYPLYILDEDGQWNAMVRPDEFLSEVAARNPHLYPSGQTGYEQYYTDMQYYWRQLYNPDFKQNKKYEPGKYTEIITKTSTGFYQKRKIWNEQIIIENEDYYDDNTPSRKWWNKNIFKNPELLNFWIDFLDTDGELSQFSVSQIGDRQKVVNDSKVSAIIFKEIPDLILYDTRPSETDPTQVPSREMLDSQTGYTWIYIPKGFSSYLNISYRNLSAKNKIDDLIYQHAYRMENISLTSIPIYSLEPNTLIRVFDKDADINGEYIVDKIGFSLSYNGTMSISASKAPSLGVSDVSDEYDIEENEQYLTFKSPEPFTLAVANPAKTWNGTLEFSTSTENWSVWDGTTVLKAANKGENYYLYIRGMGNTTIMGEQSNITSHSWILSGSNIECNGDIRTLLNYLEPDNIRITDYCFAYLFYNCSALVSAPDLPLTSLSKHCYSHTFQGCTSLAKAPELPASDLTDADYCYESMFANCLSLLNAPELPASKLATGCYSNMFYGSKLTEAPILPATTLADLCYIRMFSACTALKNAPNLPATQLTGGCYSFMFEGCKSLQTPPELPATSLAKDCYFMMFLNSGINTLPRLPATELYENCYFMMFANCTNIKLSEVLDNEYQVPYRIPAESTGINANSALSKMFDDTGGTFTGTPELNTTYYISSNYIAFHSPVAFQMRTYPGMTTKAPWDGNLEYSIDGGIVWRDFPHETYVDSGINNIILMRGSGNTKLTGQVKLFDFDGTNIRCLGNIENLLDYQTVAAGKHPVPADYAFRSMFDGCTNLIAGPDVSSVILTNGCLAEFYSGCTALAELPVFQQKTFGALSCWSMCYGCIALKLSNTKVEDYQIEYRIPNSGMGTNGSSAFNGMFNNTGGTFTGTPSINTIYYATTPPRAIFTDNCTKLFVTVQERLSQTLYFTQSAPNSVWIDWGDGSPLESSPELVLDGNDDTGLAHTYAAAGSYVIRLQAINDATYQVGTSHGWCGFITVTNGSTIGSPDVTKVVLDSHVSAIMGLGLYGCENLTEITFQAGLQSIGIIAFEGDKSLQRVNIDDLAAWCSVEISSNSNSPFRYGADLYSRGNRVTALYIPDGTTTICQYVFDGCSSITSVYIPKSVVSISNYAFSGVPNVVSISVDTMNQDYSSENGMLLNKNGTMLLQPPRALSGPVTIPATVKTIQRSAFSRMTGITTVTFPPNMTEIGEYAFWKSGITGNVTVDAITIGPSAFSNCKNLEKMWLRARATSVGASDSPGGFLHSIVLSTTDSFVLYCEPSDRPSGWHEDFNLRDGDNNRVTTVWGQTTTPW